jgi:hypothetical protein
MWRPPGLQALPLQDFREAAELQAGYLPAPKILLPLRVRSSKRITAQAGIQSRIGTEVFQAPAIPSGGPDQVKSGLPAVDAAYFFLVDSFLDFKRTSVRTGVHHNDV